MSPNTFTTRGSFTFEPEASGAVTISHGGTHTRLSADEWSQLLRFLETPENFFAQPLAA